MRSIQQLFDLSGKTAVVTGGTRSLGQAMTIVLAEAGADIILIQLNNNSDETRRIVEGLGRKVHTFVCDMNDRAGLANIIPEITASHRVDILVNAAGIVRRSPATEHFIEEFDETIQTNFTASWMLCQGVGRSWLRLGLRGKIINVSSILGSMGAVGQAPYAMSKGAIELMTKSLINEWAAKGINVNIIAPGYCDTDMNTDIRSTEDEAFKKSAGGRIPQERWGNAEDLKGPAVFLASEASAYVNRESLVLSWFPLGK